MPKFANNIDLQQNELQNAVIHSLPGAPSNPKEGQIYYNSTNGVKHGYMWNGTGWVQLDGVPTHAHPISDVTSLQSSLDGKSAVGHTHTAANITDFNNQVQQSRLDQFKAPQLPVSMGGQRLMALPTPGADDDAATKGYVDAVAQGLNTKQAVAMATTSNIPNLLTAFPTTIDGVLVSNGDRILVKDQTNQVENGIYVVTGTNASRAADANTWTELFNAYVFVENGTVNAHSGWVNTSLKYYSGGRTGIIDTDPVTFQQFSGAGQITAGTGISKSGNTLSVTNPKVKWVGDCGTSATWTISHNLASQDLHVQVYEKATMTQIFCDIVNTNGNTTTITFASNPSAAQYRAVIIG